MNFADEAVGNVTTLMKEKGLWEDMIVVFSTGGSPKAQHWVLSPVL